jgi:hypothetical protein
MPIVVYRPTLLLQPLDENGDPDGAAVDVSCDMASVELGVDQPLITVPTFCGKYSIPDDIEESATFDVTVNDETYARWAPLVGVQVQAQLKDRETDADHRAFTTEIRINPALYGPTTPGEARTISFDVPILSSPELVAGSS